MAHCAKEGYISAITTNVHPVLAGVDSDNSKPSRARLDVVFALVRQENRRVDQRSST